MRTSAKTPAPALRAAAISGSSASTTEQRVGGDRVRPEAGRVAGLRRRPAQQGLPVGRRGDGHVPALAVGEHQQAAGSGVPAGGLEREPAREAETLEARELRLDGDAGRAGGVHHGDAVREDGRGGVVRRGRLRGGGGYRRRERLGGPRRVGERGREATAKVTPVSRGRPQPRRIGIQAEDDLRLAARHRRREPVAERHGGRRLAGNRQSAVRQGVSRSSCGPPRADRP